MSRTYRTRWTWDKEYWDRTKDWHLWLDYRARDASPRSHRGRTRCMCQYPRDKWHKKRRRRAAQNGATPREAERQMGW